MNRKEKEENSKKPSKSSPKTKTSPQEKEVEKKQEEETKITQLEQEIAELKKWKEDNLHRLADQLNRLKEIEEQKKRAMVEIEKYGKQKLLTKIVDFIVNLESRVVKAMRDYPDSSGIVQSHAEGIEIALDNLKKDLAKEGVKEMEIKVGVDLQDSHLHKILGEVTNKKLPARTITEVIKKGYLLHERVFRVAEVKISKK